MGKVLLASCTVVMIMLVFFTESSSAAYNVVSYGAKGDGKKDSTAAFLRAWSVACGSRNQATIYVPRGTFLIRNVVFGGPCKSRIVLQIDGSIVAPTSYWDLGNSGNWILFNKVSRIKIYGGSFDARGAGYWACRRSGKKCPAGARSISFNWSNNVLISGVTSINSQKMHISLNHCTNFLIRNVKIRAPSNSPNTDGIHMQASSGITVTGGSIATGDDCISIGQGSTNTWIERLNCGPGHGISIGSLGDFTNEEGVENVTVSGVGFTKAENGVRIKSWGRTSNGYARNINFRNLIMNNVNNPIIIDQNYCPSSSGCPRQSSGVKISGITYKNIKGISATQIAIKFDCSPTDPCTGIRLQDINLRYLGKSRSAISYCKNAHGRSSGVVLPKSCF
ncbi:polygalacturonase-like [Carica papaya]|uniref:polygalacturonase-like n=1 Tax=Carica papaya TaxID=3649 RepID=UPI000B8CC373|nr:polygalacturonase-like [Carica papaya]